MGRILVKIAGLLLGMLLIVTGLAKAADIREFASGILREVPMLPELGTACAFVIVTAEIVAGAGFYFRRFRRTVRRYRGAAVLGFHHPHCQKDR